LGDKDLRSVNAELKRRLNWVEGEGGWTAKTPRKTREERFSI
jgi:hypothetical protein